MLLHGFDGRLAAESTTGGRKNVPGQSRKILLHARSEKNVERVLRLKAGAARRNINQLFALADDAFGEQESSGQFAVVAWRAHRHRHATSAHADFQRLLNGECVSPCQSFSVSNKADNLRGACLRALSTGS